MADERERLAKVLEGVAEHFQKSLDAQGPTPSWDYPQAEIDGKRATVFDLRMAAALLRREAPAPEQDAQSYRVVAEFEAAVVDSWANPNREDLYAKANNARDTLLAALAAGAVPERAPEPKNLCRIVEYDSAHKCLTHNRVWGAISNPDEPCAPASPGARR